MERRTKYQLSTQSEPGASSHYQRYTVDRGLNTAQAVNFVVEGKEEALIDLSQCYLKSVFRIVGEDGLPIKDVTSVFLTPNYGANLWSQVSVSLNNTQIPAGNDYPYTALLTELLGASPYVRDNLFSPLGGFAHPHYDSSKISLRGVEEWEELAGVGGNSKEVTVYHRVHSDFLQSCSQLLPNRMQLGVTLTRNKDGFVLGTIGGDETKYKIEMLSVSLFVKRIQPGAMSLAALNDSLTMGGKLQYQRLHTIVFPCADNSQTWNWHNCFNNVLPRKVFVALVTQESYFGSYDRISTYLESANVRSVRFSQDGRDVMAEPYICDFKYLPDGKVDWEKSEAKTAFAGLSQAVGGFSSPREEVGMLYLDFVNGCTVFAVSLDHAPGNRTETGSLDIHIDFASPTKDPLMVLVMGEYPRTISFDSSRSLQ